MLAATLIKEKEEPLSRFNARLEEECSRLYVVNYSAVIVDGQPVVTLFVPNEAGSLLAEDDDDDDDDDEDDDDEQGESLVLSEAPKILNLCPITARTEDEIRTTNRRLEKIMAKAGDLLSDVEYITGVSYEPQKLPSGNQVFIPVETVYAVLSWELELVEEGEDVQPVIVPEVVPPDAEEPSTEEASEGVAAEGVAAEEVVDDD